MDLLVIVLVVGGVALLLLGAITAIGWFGSEKALKPKHYEEESAFDHFALQPEPVSFLSQDGLKISGHFLPGTNAATIILCHGYGRQHQEMIPHAAYLNRLGFACLLFDQRSRGASEGTLVSVGGLERWDVIGAIDYLETRRDVDPGRIGVFGVSGGAAAAVLAAAEDDRIRAVAIECCFRNVRSVVASSFKHFTGLPAFPFADVTLKFAEIRIGYSADVLAPEKVVSAISPRPILLMHGEADRAIDCSDSVHMHELAGEPKELWMIPESGHAKGLEVAGEEYERRVAGFFQKYLSVREATPTARAARD
jgi:pimeloyl-ACP methyl ester carboxylesterase